MLTIAQHQQLIEAELSKLKFPGKPKELYEPIQYLLNLGGKRLRPALVLMATDLFGGQVNEALPAALAIELFHNFTLMHDDIMDNAPLRRGKPTVHAKWNQSIAILSGDAMFAESYKQISKIKPAALKSVLDIFNETAIGVCEGQQWDMNFELMDQVTELDYIEMIKLKTAVLLGGALKMGALIADASTQDSEYVYDFGVNLGIAFQLQDDILDVYGDPQKFGKQVGGDILANKKTFLLLKAKELANANQLIELDKWLAITDVHHPEKVNAVTQIFNALEIKELAEKEKKKFVDLAFKNLAAIQVEATQKQILTSFAENLMLRET